MALFCLVLLFLFSCVNIDSTVSEQNEEMVRPDVEPEWTNRIQISIVWPIRNAEL
jgi:hypothetical protein